MLAASVGKNEKEKEKKKRKKDKKEEEEEEEAAAVVIKTGNMAWGVRACVCMHACMYVCECMSKKMNGKI